MARITKELARKIAKKLDAEIRPERAHDRAVVYHKGQLIAHFGIRRGSRKDLGHDHIPKDLGIRPREALLLAQCPWRKEDWLAALQERGKL